MDMFECTARLQWWANGSTCLADLPITVTVHPAEGRWVARCALRDQADADVLRFFDEFDNRFDLRFDDGSVVGVVAGPPDADGRFRLAEDPLS